jgi:hypothetical protein
MSSVDPIHFKWHVLLFFLENIHFEDLKGDGRIILRYTLESKLWGYKLGGNCLRSWPKAGLSFSNTKPSGFRCQKVNFYKIRLKSDHRWSDSASCPRHTQYVRVQGLTVTFLLGAVPCYIAKTFSFGSTRKFLFENSINSGSNSM